MPRHLIGGPYTNDDVVSVIPKSLHTMRTDTVTWTVHNIMEEEEGNKESGVRRSDGKHLRSG